MKRITLSLLSLMLVVLACGQAPAAMTPTAGLEPTNQTLPAGLEPTSQPLPASRETDFTIALEYAIPGLASAYAPTGLTYAKPQPIFGMWGLIEPSPGEFNWEPLDNLVAEYQADGFSGIQLLITAESPWASVDPPSLGHPGNTLPKDEYIEDYLDFVRGFVERYDGDGVDDVPGLLYPIHHYGIEREFTGFWPSDADDYIRLLRLAYPVIHEADPKAEVLLVAILMVDVFDGNPGADELQRRLSTPQTGIRKSVPEIMKVLAACDAYDILDFHSLGDYSEIPPTTAWLRQQLQINGCDQKSIWIGDAFSMSGLVGFGGRPSWPGTQENLQQVIETLKLVANPNSDGYLTARDWLYALMAEGLVRKVIVSAGEGLEGINIGNLEDWKTSIPAADILAVPLTGTTLFMGMMDTRPTGQQVGNRLPGYRAAGDARPAYYALKLVNQMLKDFTEVEKLDLGQYVWAYRFSLPSGPLWVLWYDDDRLYFPGEIPPTVEVSLPFPSASALVTKTPSEPGATEPETIIIAASQGSLSLVLGADPVFIEKGGP